jgi:hypothetical protein
MGARRPRLKAARRSRAQALHVVDLAMSVEAQLQILERLVPHLAQHGCDISAQDGARELMRYFDASSDESGEPTEMTYERRALRRAYARLREQLNAIAEGRSGVLPVDEVGCFTRFYREHRLRIDAGQKTFRRPD